MATSTAAPYLALLGEQDLNLKSYALKSINDIVDELWSEIANNILEIEELYEDESFKDRKLAALIASKVYYNLVDYDSSVKFALVADDAFDINEQSGYVETIISKAIDQYIRLSKEQYENENSQVEIPKQLQNIFERMLNKAIKENDLKSVIGLSLDSYRLDIVENIINEQLKVDSEENVLNLINYTLNIATSIISNTSFRSKILNSLVSIITNLKTPDFFIVSKIIVNLNDDSLAVHLFTNLLKSEETNNRLIAYQVAFDLVNSSSQELLDKTIVKLSELNSNESSPSPSISKIIKILSGIPSCDFDITFLHKNNNTDIQILNKARDSLESRNSIFHSAITFENAFMHAGTTDDSFFRSNLEWLGKATNWSKFSATAALGVIHKGNLSQGRKILQPYLPGSSGSHYTKGGSLYALGLIFAGHGRETIDYLRNHVVENGSSAGNDEVDVILHGASLGTGVAGMGSGNEEIYEELKVVLYSDSAISGEAAALGMGLIMLGSGNESVQADMLSYAQETQHENIIRGLSTGIALVNYGKEEQADEVISQLLEHQNPLLRYGGAYTIALAYAGTGNNKAIKKLLHVAVSDSNDNVRRASVIALGFVLIRDYQTVPRLVELLSESHNPHVRYGTALALGISCAGRGLQQAVDVLMPLTKDPVDFVRQGALVALSMVLIQQNEKSNSKVTEVKELYASIISSKSSDALTKFGAALAQGIIDAGGRNVTIQVENGSTGTLNTKAIVGLAVFTQFWYWYPLTHFLSLAFTPTAIIGVREDLKIPKFEINCHSKKSLFDYPPKVKEETTQAYEKVETAVLSTTAKAKARAKKSQKEKKEDDMDVDEKPEDKTSKEESTKKDEEKDKEQQDTTITSEDNEDNSVSKYSKTPFKLNNVTRVLPNQLKYIAFNKDERFVPVRKYKGNGGVVVLIDKSPKEPIESIKTVRQLNNKDAPLPEPFHLENTEEED
ncbi:26S proteasome regulatory subunit [Wickerhamomyces ciferrii]|uniref:26S proteasome regulatory subunit RPN2 n=1 Tax=Wickerhamomyces ciferrii (strain ATCC 14091 / BCRC 22168 / CBS 111 / JCM 3599 / NBRC 0793 / NRRL Y-1031 F-60-10) TaxID=1206466 RepID=K0KMB5_WICCF|nr:26S proteasome regulatory subunit [Wickerhamomyces ciferrii]CCH43332.1 26S proteasome regulatory subunit [Wickerhamomyces ciferrii]